MRPFFSHSAVHLGQVTYSGHARQSPLVWSVPCVGRRMTRELPPLTGGCSVRVSSGRIRPLHETDDQQWRCQAIARHLGLPVQWSLIIAPRPHVVVEGGGVFFNRSFFLFFLFNA